MKEFPPSPSAAATGELSKAEFITCLNGYPEAPAETFEIAVAFGREFRPASTEKAISIYDVGTRIHYDLDVAVIITCRRMWNDMLASFDEAASPPAA